MYSNMQFKLHKILRSIIIFILDLRRIEAKKGELTFPRSYMWEAEEAGL